VGRMRGTGMKVLLGEGSVRGVLRLALPLVRIARIGIPAEVRRR
jgi:hypothetical protein